MKGIYLNFIFTLIIELSVCKKCEHPKYRQELFELNLSSEDESKLPPQYDCPQDVDPTSYTECCVTGGCCPKLTLNQMPELFVMVTAIVVITCCLLLTALVLVCCFWHQCPLYDTCRANYNSSDVIMYTLAKEEDPLTLMPVEDGVGTVYKHTPVKIRPVDDV